VRPGSPGPIRRLRGKVIDTVLGPVTLTRAWYHCAACGHGRAFAKAAGLLEDLAGVHLTTTDLAI